MHSDRFPLTLVRHSLSFITYLASLVFPDEEDMGMSYEELGVFGRLRKVFPCHPTLPYRI